MFEPDRQQVRQFMIDTWQKHLRHAPLDGVQSTLVSVLEAHPEYHHWLVDNEDHLDKDFSPENGLVNPFLHLSLHLAITEQLNIDQPPGIRAKFDQLMIRRQDRHAAQHAMMDCLAEMIWQAQRDATGYQLETYFACLDRQTHATGAVATNIDK